MNLTYAMRTRRVGRAACRLQRRRPARSTDLLDAWHAIAGSRTAVSLSAPEALTRIMAVELGLGIQANTVAWA